ncbi:uncharacterized protein [Parasteatoda tepidariorum]|uniref:uncharacterized protein isoform X2 n=1 Tax=Parasteatoda tepidariorum TaxID=114398 RepID=UPI00077FCE72|nr:uncharacterized protein LOC107450436 isoform X2 [Parasteatoda tepidariorum]
MRSFSAVMFLVAVLVTIVYCDEPKIGRPQFSLDAAGGGNNKKNFNVGYNAGLGTRVWQSKRKDMSLDVGATYGRGIARVDGHTFKSKPQYGLGATFKFGKK